METPKQEVQEILNSLPEDATIMVSESAHALLLEFLNWSADRPRSYDDAMEAWQSHCPRQTIREDAVIGGLIETSAPAGDHLVVLTARGEAVFSSQIGAQTIPPRRMVVNSRY